MSTSDTYRFATFVVIGIGSALADILLLQTLWHSGVHYGIAATAGFVVGLLINYVGHTRITFQKKETMQNLAGYLIVVFINYLITLLCVSLSENYLDNVLIGKLISLPLVAVNGYLCGKYWVYK